MSGSPVYPEEFRIEEAKIVGYLLNPAHADGGPKCRFLLAFGFSVGDPIRLMQALVSHPAPDRLARAYTALRGFKLHFEGPLQTPDGIDPNVRSVWQVDLGTDGRVARFITMKPLKRLAAAPRVIG